ncbi:hypothetical protein ADM96_37525 [Burkholderia sp. ST111]|nr:hypothetical protein ADM96_37525 [Burkholderia sp. ST111]
MKKKLEILILDDNDDSGRANEQRIRSACELSSIEVNVSYIEEGRKSALIGAIDKMGSEDAWNDPEAFIGSLDDLKHVDVLFIDYQLKTLKNHAWLTAENVAGWIRAYSDIPVIGILNRFFDVDFDLSMLLGTSATSADFHVNDRLLTLPALWTEATGDTPTKDSFHPWQWPMIPRVVEDVAACRADLEQVDLSSEILPFFGFSEQDVEQLTRHALGYLDPTSVSPANATFLQFLKEGRLATPKELRLALSNALEEQAAPKRDELRRVVARILTSELRRWLSNLVLLTQDVLIDAPHLANRMPWVLQESNNLEKRRLLVTSRYKEAFAAQVEPYTFQAERWLSRPAFWVAKIQKDDAIDDLYRDYETPEDEQVFLEDFSCFVGSAVAEPFQPAFDSVWPTRYVYGEAVSGWGYKYAPKVRLI